MAVTAENLAAKYSISREDCDRYALKTQQRCKAGEWVGQGKPLCATSFKSSQFLALIQSVLRVSLAPGALVLLFARCSLWFCWPHGTNNALLGGLTLSVCWVRGCTSQNVYWEPLSTAFLCLPQGHSLAVEAANTTGQSQVSSCLSRIHVGECNLLVPLWWDAALSQACLTALLSFLYTAEQFSKVTHILLVCQHVL